MKKNVIFVDCFNTIICRNKPPKAVIFDWAKKVGEKFGIEPRKIYEYFYCFQRKIFLKNKLSTKEGEFVFEDIIKMIARRLEEDKFEQSKSFIENALKLYIEAEKESHFVNEKIVEQLRLWKESGKKIYIVSDFYCGKEIISKWLEELHVLDIFDDIFVSCDFKKSKRTGRLYKYIIKQLNLNKREIMMIGDNFHADFLKARTIGIFSKKIKSISKNKVDKNFKLSVKYGANFPEYLKIFDKFGGKLNYSNYAFPFYLFNKRLCETLKKENVHNLFFISREGQFLKKLFDKYCAINNFQIRTHYFYASRNSVLVAGLDSLEKEDFYLILRSVLNMTIRRFLSTLNFSKEEIERIDSEISVNIDKSSTNFTKSKEFEALKQNETFKVLYDKKREEQQKAFAGYLKTFNVDFEKEGFHMVDVGWYGTIQDCIAKYFTGRVETTGYYMGTFEKEKYPHANKIGLFFAKPNNHRFGNQILRHRRLDYEQLCRADHNRVKGYKIANNKCEIILGDEVNDNLVFNKLIGPLQDQIYDKYAKICELDFKLYSNIEAVVLKMFYKMICHQSKDDFEWLRQAEDCCFDNFARIGFTAKKFADSLRIFAYKAWDLWFKIRFYLKIKLLK
ncbi:MAG: HAD-IA family hydrolase [Candidatus Caccovivens sp.]